MSIQHTLYKFGGAVAIFFGDRAKSLAGQKRNYAIIQTAHRIEKGLTFDNPKKRWGWSKVESLVGLVDEEVGCENPDWFAVNTAAAVLKAYREAKEQSGDTEEFEKAEHFLQKYPRVERLVRDCVTPGGAVRQTRDQVLFDGGADWTEQLFKTRHSVRDFDPREVSREDLNRAIQMALFAPSACNRQPVHVYVIPGKKKEAMGYDNNYHAEKYLLITGDMGAFTSAEYGDWVVSASIFSAYLVLALHSLGIGSCVMRKEMYFGSEYNAKVRKACRIPGNEKIILEIAIGYYKDTFSSACSNRKSAEDVVTYI